MSFLNKLFGKKKAGNLRCDFCGKKLSLSPPQSGTMTMAIIGAMTKQIGLWCANCKKAACMPCSFAAAQAQGKRHFICPTCGSDIQDSYATGTNIQESHATGTNIQENYAKEDAESAILEHVFADGTCRRCGMSKAYAENFKSSCKRSTATPVDNALSNVSDPIADKYFWQSVEALKNGNTREAIGYLEKAVDLDPKNTKYWNNLATFLGNVGDWDKAEAAWEKLLQLNPDNQQRSNFVATSTNRALSAKKEGQVSEMARIFERILEIDPSYALALNELGFYYQETKQYDKAIPFLQRALEDSVISRELPRAVWASYEKLEDHWIDVRKRIASCYLAMGDYPAAIRYWEEALKEKGLSSSDRQSIEENIRKAKERRKEAIIEVIIECPECRRNNKVKVDEAAKRQPVCGNCGAPLLTSR